MSWPRFPHIVLAGLAGEVAFEAYAWIINPMLFGFTLQPALLIAALSDSLFGYALSYDIAFALHIAAGFILFPLTYLAFRAFSPIHSPWVNGIVWGLVLWAFGQGVLAPIAGRPVFMGFETYTWSSLVAHPVYILVVALSVDRLNRLAARPRTPSPIDAWKLSRTPYDPT